MTRCLLLAFAFAALSLPAVACDLHVSSAPRTLQLTGSYNPLSQENRSLNATIRVRNAGAACSASFSLTSATGGVRLSGAGSETLNLEARNSAGLPIEVSIRQGSVDPGSLVATVAFAEHQEQAVDLSFNLAPGQLVTAGRYHGDVSISIQQDDGAAQIQLPLDIDVDVADAAEIRLSGAVASPSRGVAAGGQFAAPIIQLGDLASNQEINTLPVVLMIVSTSRYALRFESANHGRLQHIDGPAIVTGDYGYIPYELLVDRIKAPLETPGGELLRPRPSGFFRTDLLPLAIRVGDTTGQPAGIYRDTVRIEVLPRG